MQQPIQADTEIGLPVSGLLLLVLVLTSASSPGMPGPVHSGHPYHFRKLRFPNSQTHAYPRRHGRFHLLQKGILCHIGLHDIGLVIAIVGH